MPVPFNNLQPAVAVTQAIVTYGPFPSRDSGSFDTETMGAIRHFAGFFNPQGTMSTHGQLLAISSNTALFSLLSDTYGGDGRSVFALPNLDITLSVGTGQGQGLTERSLGVGFGEAATTLLRSNLTSFYGGASIPADNSAPSLPTTYLINVVGPYAGSELDMLGAVWQFAGNFAPAGTLPCDGRLLQISEYDALFSLIGTIYGGDGQETFALPDLRGRTVVGVDSTHPLGSLSG